MMSALEREIIEKFRQLDQAAQKRVRDWILHEADESPALARQAFNDESWRAEVEAAQATLRPDASGHIPSASELLDEIREERDADILRSLGLWDSGEGRVSI